MLTSLVLLIHVFILVLSHVSACFPSLSPSEGGRFAQLQTWIFSLQVSEWFYMIQQMDLW